MTAPPRRHGTAHLFKKMHLLSKERVFPLVPAPRCSDILDASSRTNKSSSLSFRSRIEVTLNNKLTIGKLAQTAGVRVSTIRYYQRQGLLREPKKPERGGFRAYERTDLARLLSILQAKGLGFTLSETEHLLDCLDRRDCKSILDLAGQKLQMVEAQIDSLEKARRTLRDLLGECMQDCQDPCHVIRHLAAQNIYTLEGP